MFKYLGIVVSVYSVQAIAQSSPPIKMLTAAECKMVSQNSENESFVTGPLKIGSATLTNSVAA